ncbi:MAG: hypothetical protein ACREIW_06395 [Chthoniobacterales bacterium]
MTLEDRLLERVGQEFAGTEQAIVVELLSSYAGREAERVRWDILKLSNGSLEKVRQYIEAARVGYRDFLYWTKYFDEDLILRTRGRRSWSNRSSPNAEQRRRKLVSPPT